ncbi:hypothetical protein B0H14DRAFT_2556849 [Mycena olivaceomarginata]|nr:hypothetical protein B0H14DRAFT_2556849 [Mycena olivaceomarginata]
MPVITASNDASQPAWKAPPGLLPLHCNAHAQPVWEAMFLSQTKWRVQAILPDGIKLGGTCLQPKPSQPILPDAIKLGGDVACDDNGGEALTDETQEDIYR